METSGISFRLARPAEATAIAKLSRDLVEQGLRWRWTPARVAESIRAPNVNVLVACAHDTIAGFAIMRYGDKAHLDLLAVAPSYRRTGLGRRLVEWLEKCAVAAGISSVTLEVRAGNEGAQLFYKNMGYRVLSELAGYYQGVEAALRMGRDLSCQPDGVSDWYEKPPAGSDDGNAGQSPRKRDGYGEKVKKMGFGAEAPAIAWPRCHRSACVFHRFLRLLRRL